MQTVYGSKMVFSGCVAVDARSQVRDALGVRGLPRGLRRTHRAVNMRDGKGRVYPVGSKFIHEQTRVGGARVQSARERRRRGNIVARQNLHRFSRHHR